MNVFMCLCIYVFHVIHVILVVNCFCFLKQSNHLTSFIMWHISISSYWLYHVIGYPQLCRTVCSAPYADTSRITQQLHCEKSGASRILCKSGLGVHMASYIHVSSRDFNSSTLEPDRPAAEWQLPFACVIAPQYSPTTFVSLHFHLCKTNFGVSSEMLLLFF
jgi:hypothetical protein